MILLQNFDYATRYFDYQSKTEISESANSKINGWYKFVNELLSALIVIDDGLYFLYGEDEFLMTDSHTVMLKPQSEFQNECSITNGTDILASFLYPLPDLKLNVSPFEYIDEEDSNWGEFIAKVINDQERKRNFVTIYNN